MEAYTEEQVQEAGLEYFGGNQLQADTWRKKYCLRDKEGNYLERTPADMFRRLAREFARIEQRYPNPRTEEDIYEQLGKTIWPQGSPMFGIGNPAPVSLSNCAVVAPPGDNMISIFDTGKDLSSLYRRRFGAGLDLSNLRPEGAPVNNAARHSSGAWSFAEHYSHITRMIGQSGRRGALMLTMDIRHPDIEKFITMKADLTKVTGANVSVKVTDEFMQAVEEDAEWDLYWPVDWSHLDMDKPKVHRQVKARDLFKLIAKTACETGEPGFLFWDTIRKNLPLDRYTDFRTSTTNPCTSGETMVLTTEGPRRFDELAAAGKNVMVYALDPVHNEPVVKWMRRPRCVQKDVEVFEVEFDSGLKVKCTGDHYWIDPLGRKRQTLFLQPGDRVAAYSLSRSSIGRYPHYRVRKNARAGSGDHFKTTHRMVAECLGIDVEGKMVTVRDHDYTNLSPDNIHVFSKDKIYEEFSWEDHPFDQGNHKVVSITAAGREDVYSGVVDDFHTYVIADPEPVNENSLYTGVVSCNCGEIPLSPYDSCRLISVYLPDFVQKEFSEDAYFDFERFKEVAGLAMRLSDDLVDLELEKLHQIVEVSDTEDEKELFRKFIKACRDGRRTGLGTHGLADALARLGLRYDSVEALQVVDRIYETLKISAYTESIVMAEERGNFPAWNWNIEKECEFFRGLPTYLVNEMARVGRRNGAILTNAPTGTVSLLSDNCSSGIEPVFKLEYRRRVKQETPEGADLIDPTGDAWKEYSVYHSNLQRYWDATGKDDVPEYFITAEEIDPLKRVEVQAVVSSHIDHSLSSTINLPVTATPEMVEQIYMEAWRSGCRGITVYRAGSRPAEILSSVEEPSEECEECPSTPHRPRHTPGVMTKAEFTDSLGRRRHVYIFVGNNHEGEVVETFVIDEFGGPEIHSYSAAVGRMVSLALKMGVDPNDVASKLIGLRGDSQSFSGGMYSSVPDLLGKLLVEHRPVEARENPTTKAPKGVARGGCPACGGDLTRSEQCLKCLNCGWSKC